MFRIMIVFMGKHRTTRHRNTIGNVGDFNVSANSNVRHAMFVILERLDKRTPDLITKPDMRTGIDCVTMEKVVVESECIGLSRHSAISSWK